MSKIIDILITLDTDRVKRDFPSPSKDSTTPTPIGHDYGYMVASGIPPAVPGQPPSITGQGTGDLGFSANVGDAVRVFADSGSNNFEDAVLLYGMPKFQNTQVMSDFSYTEFEKSAIQANQTNGTSPLPVQIVDNQPFWFFQGNVARKGSEGYSVQFGLYARDTTGSPALFGYYQWDPTINVAG